MKVVRQEVASVITPKFVPLAQSNVLYIGFRPKAGGKDLIQMLKEIGCSVSALHTKGEEKNLKEAFDSFPDVIFLDARNMISADHEKLIKFLNILSTKNVAVPIALVLHAKSEIEFPVGRPWLDRIDWPMSSSSLMQRVEFYSGLRREWMKIEERETALVDTLVSLKEIQTHWERLSYMDALTEISNRRRFDEMIKKECRRATRDEVPLALVLLDIDYFKGFNDQHGHLAGDDCLRQVAACIARTVKRPADFVARFGGEEFACILPSTSPKGAWNVAENMRKNIESLAIPNNASPNRVVTVSIGIAAAEFSSSEMMNDLFLKADNSLYLAKKLGRNRIELDKL